MAKQSPWRAAVVTAIEHPNPNGVRLRLQVPDRAPHLPGQHYVLRLTAEDGYTAQRSYSIASAPSDPELELWVERQPDGEVSGFLAGIAEVGDVLELRGPIGGWFVWDGTTPALAVGGGSGVVPFVSMLRHARETGRADLLRVAVSARTRAELPYADELAAAGAVIALTREDRPADLQAPDRPAGRLTHAELYALHRPGDTVFLCGSAAFAEAATDLVLAFGVLPGDIKVERFGPS